MGIEAFGRWAVLKPKIVSVGLFLRPVCSTGPGFVLPVIVIFIPQ